MIDAEVPAADEAASIQISGRAPSSPSADRAHRPRGVRILSPRRGARVRGPTTLVRWRARDEDRARRRISVEYSADGGEQWRTIYMGRNLRRRAPTVTIRAWHGMPRSRQTARSWAAGATFAIDRFMYGFSVWLCLSASMAEQPSAATGTVMWPETFRRYALEAGFRDVQILDIDLPMQRYYRLVP